MTNFSKNIFPLTSKRLMLPHLNPKTTAVFGTRDQLTRPTNLKSPQNIEAVQSWAEDDDQQVAPAQQAVANPAEQAADDTDDDWGDWKP